MTRMARATQRLASSRLASVQCGRVLDGSGARMKLAAAAAGARVTSSRGDDVVDVIVQQQRNDLSARRDTAAHLTSPHRGRLTAN